MAPVATSRTRRVSQHGQRTSRFPSSLRLSKTFSGIPPVPSTRPYCPPPRFSVHDTDTPVVRSRGKRACSEVHPPNPLVQVLRVPLVRPKLGHQLVDLRVHVRV